VAEGGTGVGSRSHRCLCSLPSLVTDPIKSFNFFSTKALSPSDSQREKARSTKLLRDEGQGLSPAVLGVSLAAGGGGLVYTGMGMGGATADGRAESNREGFGFLCSADDGIDVAVPCCGGGALQPCP
jgi:hypothetical protein